MLRQDVALICLDVQALVRVVVQNMGGPASAGELAQRCWDHMQQLKYRLALNFSWILNHILFLVYAKYYYPKP